MEAAPTVAGLAGPMEPLQASVAAREAEGTGEQDAVYPGGAAAEEPDEPLRQRAAHPAGSGRFAVEPASQGEDGGTGPARRGRPAGRTRVAARRLAEGE